MNERISNELYSARKYYGIENYFFKIFINLINIIDLFNQFMI